MTHSQRVALLLLIAGSYSVQACSVPNWEEMTVAQQTQEANIAVYGYVTAHYPMLDEPVDTAYTATMDVICVFKGGDLPPIINITEAGELTSCHHTELPLDQEFFVLLKMDQNGVFTPDEVNYLSVAFEANNWNFKQVVDGVGGDIDTECPQWEGGRRGAAGTLHFNGYLKIVMSIVVWYFTSRSLKSIDN
ncbi:uncharacterized protein [Asterias amurensis]|uniref:uncharacterized protein n=1 Tax=Asterias amurensis TaxID=7602 RepID=UPI003AB61FEE